jgi:hypothetical protein
MLLELFFRITSRMSVRSDVAMLAGAACIMIAGCDPVRTTRQTVVLSVLDSDSESPVTSARVRLKDDFDRQEHTFPDTATKEEWEAHARRNWEQREWFDANTDHQGSATVNIEYTALDRTRGNVPPPDTRDWVTDAPFLVAVTVDGKPPRLISIELTPGNAVADSEIILRVEAVKSPVYIPTK